MLSQELTSEERACQKVARRRFREIVKQRWEEEKLKTLSQKAFKKIKRTENLRATVQTVHTPVPQSTPLSKIRHRFLWRATETKRRNRSLS